MKIKSKEETGNKIWRVVLKITTPVIIIIAAYLLFSLFAGNPLEGQWAAKKGSMTLNIRAGGTATVGWSEISESSNVKVKIHYTLNKDAKTISFKVDRTELEKAAAASDSGLTVQALETEIGMLETTFDYSLENDTLTLSEREYGEQLVFTRK